MPVILGYHPLNLQNPFMCSLDLSLPSVLVPNTECENCEGQRFVQKNSNDPDNTKPSNDQSSISHNTMYLQYTEGSYKVQSESEMMIINYNNQFHLQDQIFLESYEFYSILEDNDEQNQDLMFGLGLLAPQHIKDDGETMNVLMWFQKNEFIRKKIAAIYLGVWDGRKEDQNINQQQDAQNLPHPNVQFGQFNLTDIAKKDEIHFFTRTSQYNWTLDFYGFQEIGSGNFYDYDPSESKNGQWENDPEQENQKKLNKDNVFKAYFNPSTPFISLPNSLFQLVAKSWLDAFPEDQKAYCGNRQCVIFSKCSEVRDVTDFAIKLGSINDTSIDNDETEDQEETDNVIRRGPIETIFNEWRPMFFRIPFESYLIPGPVLGRDENLCYLSITGDIPDSEKMAVIGQPFFQNYYTVLDQEKNKLGFAANIGSQAELSATPFNDNILVQIILGILAFIISVVLIFFLVKEIQRRTLKRKLDKIKALGIVDIHKEIDLDYQRERRLSLKSDRSGKTTEPTEEEIKLQQPQLSASNSKNKYLAPAKFEFIEDDNSLLDTSSQMDQQSNKFDIQ